MRYPPIMLPTMDGPRLPHAPTGRIRCWLTGDELMALTGHMTRHAKKVRELGDQQDAAALERRAAELRELVALASRQAA